MANLKVSEMNEATSFDDEDYAMIVQINQNKKITKENMFSSTNDEIINLRIALGIENDTYNPGTTYNVSDLVVKNHKIYECNENNITGEWDSSKWTLVPVIID